LVANMDITSYVHNLSTRKYRNLFAEDCVQAFAQIAEAWGAMVTNETIQEIDLSSPSLTADFSYKIKNNDRPYLQTLFQTPLLQQLSPKSQVWTVIEKFITNWAYPDAAMYQKVRNIWLEFDYQPGAQAVAEPSFFFDASDVRPGADNAWIYHSPLPILLGNNLAEKIKPELNFCIEALTGYNRNLFQLGVMLGRQEKGVRLFTSNLSGKQLIDYLTAIKWSGDIAGLSQWLEDLAPYVSAYILDFDIYPAGIAEKIGINFGLRQHDDRGIKEFIAFLQDRGLCSVTKGDGINEWLQEYPDFADPIYNDISHFKLVCTGDEQRVKVKAYLRKGTIPYRPVAAFARPRLMNIELTTRCPLHCPQCYCDLSRGQDIDIDVARKFIKEAGAIGIANANLSGGETLLYPHLLELISCCRENGIKANVALSGYGFNEDVLEKMILAGIDGIYISLNGSTEAINRHSRDGYKLAVKALQILKAANFPNYAINWVAHQHNVMDFPDLLSLAAAYRVPSVVVMAFKPDSKHALPSFPDRENLLWLANFIKKHQDGPVKIVVENCFSQLKDIMGEKFFLNLNQGIEQGCKAGRGMN